MIEPNPFRPDIEGLRGVAVLAVLIFHALPGWLPGGFVGVDVFFVISGYLVTQLLVRRLDTGTLSIRDFYAGRIRRVFPALIVVLVAVTTAGGVLLPPAAMRELGQTLGYGAVFLANLIFYRLSDYFAGPAELKPLLHIWSLAVEEQYYLLAPLAMWALHRQSRAKLFALLAAAALIAALGALALASIDPSVAFYSLLGRASELLAGAALACMRTAPGAAGLPRHPLFPKLAVGLLVATLLAPAGWNLPPIIRGMAASLATCLLVLPRTASSSPSATPWLAHWGLRFFGRISYSLYLWHWPLLVLAKYALLRDLERLESVGCLLLATALALFTTRWVETPTRAWPSRLRHWGPAAALAAGLCVATAVAMVKSQGWPQRFNETSLALFRAAGDISPMRTSCHVDASHPRAYEQKCSTAPTSGSAGVLVWADSHGVELAAALGERLAETGTGVAQITASGCPPSHGYSPQSSPWCAAHNERVLAGIKADAGLKDIVLIARYGSYLKSDEVAYPAGFSSMLAQLSVTGKRVIVLTPIPGARFDVPVGLGMAQARSVSFAPLSRAEAANREAPATALLQQLTLKHPNLVVMSLWNVACDQHECPVQRAGTPLYFDDNHLSMHGARHVASGLAPLEPQLGGAPGGGAYNQQP